jgi:hypothetical protein
MKLLANVVFDLTPRSQKLLDTMRMLEQSNVESRQGDTALADSRRAELAAPSPIVLIASFPY